MRSPLAVALSAAFLSLHILPAHSYVNYANEFIDPKIILAGNFVNTTIDAQATVIEWADDLAKLGPWSVTNKPFPAPSGDKHDYMSWAPYWWPDCSKAGNTTELTPEQIWATCQYVSRDGLFNPDARTINDIGAADEMANAILFNSLAWAINGSSVYSSNVVKWINTWFLDPETLMNPNLNYAQMQRGPDGQNGTHTGILDLKSMTKIVSGVLLLREGKAPEWTSEIDSGLNAWVTTYIGWLETAKIALEEKASLNNHGSFYFNQLAALQALVGDNAGAKKTLEEYFNGIYKGQIDAKGDQPLETARTRPYHYRAYNLAAMITNAKIGAYIGYEAWDLKTDAGTGIPDALAYATTLPAGKEVAAELWPNVLAVGAHYGDPDFKYAKFLLANAGSAYPADPTFLWNQPFSDSGLVKPSSTSTTDAQDSGKGGDNGAATQTVSVWGVLAVGALTLLLA